jgi:hypothetical protein
MKKLLGVLFIVGLAGAGIIDVGRMHGLWAQDTPVPKFKVSTQVRPDHNNEGHLYLKIQSVDERTVALKHVVVNQDPSCVQEDALRQYQPDFFETMKFGDVRTIGLGSILSVTNCTEVLKVEIFTVDGDMAEFNFQ